ncbi:MAG: CHRD domain-containing protein [Elainella sp. C42_A2020_010]|nr:CHRD domain-containing protein [Elainella sp. C42_A2020_010]RNJ68714.1 MAG: hypothetical protein EDM05_13645 [Leptolyngbya sp. IPPAS B-1204]
MALFHHGENGDLSAVDASSLSGKNPYLGDIMHQSKDTLLQGTDLDSSLGYGFGSAKSNAEQTNTNVRQSTSSSSSSSADLHNHAKPESTEQSLHISLDAVEGARSLKSKKVPQRSLAGMMGKRGDFLDPGAGKNTVISGVGNDIILGRGGGNNTITTGPGKDIIVLGKETTNRIFDFDPAKDRLAVSGDLKISDLMIAQGKNPGKGGVDQPLDSENNTLIIDKNNGHILAALTFVKAETLNEKNFMRIKPEALDGLAKKNFFNQLKANDSGQQLTGTRGRDKMIGGKGDDFLYLGDDSFRFDPATGSGPGEFPFPNNSPGTSEMNLDLKGGVLRVSGTYKDFEGLPLFSDGVQDVAPDAVIPNGADPKALIEGFLQVPNDAEGNPISGFHLHFSRENFADATVERYFTVQTADAQSGQVSAEFELSPELQAALLAKNLYGNLHSTKHPVGENRIEFKTVRFI